MDKGTIQELHALRLMSLTPTHNDCSRFRHLAKILLLVHLRCIGIVFMMLKCGNDKVAFCF